jgi:hypothetical protein
LEIRDQLRQMWERFSSGWPRIISLHRLSQAAS